MKTLKEFIVKKHQQKQTGSVVSVCRTGIRNTKDANSHKVVDYSETDLSNIIRARELYDNVARIISKTNDDNEQFEQLDDYADELRGKLTKIIDESVNVVIFSSQPLKAIRILPYEYAMGKKLDTERVLAVVSNVNWSDDKKLFYYLLK